MRRPRTQRQDRGALTPRRIPASAAARNHANHRPRSQQTSNSDLKTTSATRIAPPAAHQFRLRLARCSLATAAMSTPRFWSQPIRYLRWASHEKPAIFYSIVVGLAGPATIVVVPPVRRLIGDEVGRPPIPLTYPSKCARGTRPWNRCA